MTSPLISIRRQLLYLSLLLLLGSGLAAYWGAKAYGERAARISFDQLMLGSVLQMAESISLADGDIVIDLPRSAFEILAMARNDRAFYGIFGPDHQRLTGYDDIPQPPLDAVRTSANPDTPVQYYYYATYRGERVRFLAIHKQLIEDDRATEVTIIVGQTLAARQALADEISLLVLQYVIAFFCVALLLLVFGIRKILKPLHTLELAIAARSPVDVQPLAVAVPKEIKPLVDTINHYMAQLDSTLSRLDKFTAEAAHQMRTPLAGLKLQAENALEETEPGIRQQQLQQILESANLLANTVNQLLNQATLAHRFQSETPQWLSLDRLVQESCRELVVWALNQEVEIAYLSELQVRLKGDDFALKQMLRNLIENAVKYSPPGGTVEVDIHLDEQAFPARVVLQIRDQGTGIPDEEKEQVFERFYRAQDNLHPGVGIGLAMAREVAEHHHAHLRLKDNEPQGLIVEVVFPYPRETTI
ncbi:sensor histidine kinase [Phytohalomonas tamaricis]|uniref:sensor histidine kinase n=1 Tax=Phytohalomonas tamaricis TaxID=2081032 RepID=UPI000D0AE1E9|nr:sensor histidine kinase [Phytohalomonas tamaricis]